MGMMSFPLSFTIREGFEAGFFCGMLDALNLS